MSSSNSIKDEDLRNIKSLHWKPWVGSHYFDDLNKRLLIVGESHYCWKDDKHSPEEVNKIISKDTFTREFVDNNCISNFYSTHPIARNTERALFSKQRLTVQNCKKLWQAASFYNFIQRPLLSRAKIHRPIDSDWIIGWDVFFKIVRVLQPSHILFCGVGALNKKGLFWKALKDNQYKCIEKIIVTDVTIGGTYVRSKGIIEDPLVIKL